MNLRIVVYPQSQFLKSGKLKKKAKPDFSRAFYDVQPLSKEDVDSFLVGIVVTLKEMYENFETPNVMTHIKAKKKGTDEVVYIFEDAMLPSGWVVTSPVALFVLLK